MGSSSSFWGFSYSNLLLVFLNLLFFRNLYHMFVASVGTFFGSFFSFLFVIFLYLILG